MLTARAALALLVGESEVGKRAYCNPSVGPAARDLGLHPLSTDRLAALTQTIIAHKRTFIIYYEQMLSGIV